MLRVMLLGSGGEFPSAVLAALQPTHHVAMVVMPGRSGALWRRTLSAVRKIWRKPDPLEQAATRRKILLRRVTSKKDPSWPSLLAIARPDLICIASFPWLLPRQVFESPRLGAINLHPSLLPYGRGPSPMFWVYYDDLRQSGVTVHRVTARADAGAILGQEVIELPLGTHIQSLYNQTATRGAALTARVVDQLELGSATEIAQDEGSATRAPRPPLGSAMVDFANWPVDRVWRFLHGLYPHYQEPLITSEGAKVEYTGVGEFCLASDCKPAGTLEVVSQGWRLHCRGGFIHLQGRKRGGS